MTSIGQGRIETIEVLVIAHINHGFIGESLYEGILRDIPQDWFTLHTNAKMEIESVIKQTIADEIRD